MISKTSSILALGLLIACGETDMSGKSSDTRKDPTPAANASDPGPGNNGADGGPTADGAGTGAENGATKAQNTKNATDKSSAVTGAGGDAGANATGPISDLGVAGPYKVASYTEGLADAAYGSAIIYYPVDVSNGVHAATTMSGGFTNTKEDMAWLAQHLASHGFIVIDFTPTNNMVLDANVWATGHKGGITKLKSENQRQGSPIHGKVALDRLNVSGFSMGGAGTIVAENELGTQLKSAVPICPFSPGSPHVAVPTLFITGTADTLALPELVRASYQNMSGGAPKALVDFKGMTHFGVYLPSAESHTNVARYLTGWLKIYLDNDHKYEALFSGPLASAAVSKGIFASAQDIQFHK